MSSSSLWKESKDYIEIKNKSVEKCGLRFHSFGNLSEKWIRSSIPQNLNQLWIQSCKLERESVAAFPSQLKQLVIKDCKTLKDAYLSFLPPTLQMLVIFKCPNITDQGIINISKSPVRNTLTHLDLTCNTNITNTIFEYLPPKLEFLELSSCKLLTEDGIAPHGLPNTLKSLSLNCIDGIGNNLFKFLPPNLTYLDLVHTNAKLCSEFKNHIPKSLQEIRLCSCNNITKQTVDFLPSCLTRLSLMHCKGLPSDIIDVLPKDLKVLSLYGSATDDMLKRIPKSVTELDLAASKLITDEGIAYLRNCNNLKILRIDEARITSQCLSDLPKSLQEISISKCELMDGYGFDNLPSQIYRITALECPMISARSISKLQKDRSHVIVMTSYSITREVLNMKFTEELSYKKKKQQLN